MLLLVASQAFNLIENNLTLLVASDSVNAIFPHPDKIEAHHRNLLDFLGLEHLDLSFVVIIDANSTVRATNPDKILQSLCKKSGSKC